MPCSTTLCREVTSAQMAGPMARTARPIASHGALPMASPDSGTARLPKERDTCSFSAYRVISGQTNATTDDRSNVRQMKYRTAGHGYRHHHCNFRARRTSRFPAGYGHDGQQHRERESGLLAQQREHGQPDHAEQPSSCHKGHRVRVDTHREQHEARHRYVEYACSPRDGLNLSGPHHEDDASDRCRSSAKSQVARERHGQRTVQAVKQHVQQVQRTRAAASGEDCPPDQKRNGSYELVGRGEELALKGPLSEHVVI